MLRKSDAGRVLAVTSSVGQSPRAYWGAYGASKAALETLAVVAYRQPVTRLDVEMVRGVKCDYSMQSLMAKGLIGEVGRKETIGRPILYATTDLFLSHFGLQTLGDLPKPPEKPAAAEDEQMEFPV